MSQPSKSSTFHKMHLIPDYMYRRLMANTTPMPVDHGDGTYLTLTLADSLVNVLADESKPLEERLRIFTQHLVREMRKRKSDPEREPESDSINKPQAKRQKEVLPEPEQPKTPEQAESPELQKATERQTEQNLEQHMQQKPDRPHHQAKRNRPTELKIHSQPPPPPQQQQQQQKPTVSSTAPKPPQLKPLFPEAEQPLASALAPTQPVLREEAEVAEDKKKKDSTVVTPDDDEFEDAFADISDVRTLTAAQMSNIHDRFL